MRSMRELARCRAKPKDKMKSRFEPGAFHGLNGTLMYPHLQKFVPPIPSRFVQTREATQAAISDTYNGDGKVYSALRAAAYVSWGIVTSLGAPSETGLRA